MSIALFSASTIFTVHFTDAAVVSVELALVSFSFAVAAVSGVSVEDIVDFVSSAFVPVDDSVVTDDSECFAVVVSSLVGSSAVVAFAVVDSSVVGFVGAVIGFVGAVVGFVGSAVGFVGAVVGFVGSAVGFVGSADIIASNTAVLKLFHNLITKRIIAQLGDHGRLAAKFHISAADIGRSASYLWFKCADVL